jgi:hypothetical protein
MTHDKTSETLQQIVPQGRALWWILGVSVFIFLTGVTFGRRTDQYRELPMRVTHMDSVHVALIADLTDRVQAIRTSSDANAASIGTLRLELQANASNQRRLLCLVEIGVTGETLTPFALERRCRPAGEAVR